MAVLEASCCRHKHMAGGGEDRRMEKALDEFRPGERGRVMKLSAEGKIKRRLYDMGVTPGAEILLRKVAPLGDPVEVTLRGYELTLRKAEAATVRMEIFHG